MKFTKNRILLRKKLLRYYVTILRENVNEQMILC